MQTMPGLLAIVGVVVVGALVSRRSLRPFDSTREAAASVLGVAGLLLWCFSGAPVWVRPGVFTLAGLVAAWWAVAALCSPRPDLAAKRALQFFGCMAPGILFVSQVPIGLVMRVLVIAAALHALVGIVQYRTGRRIISAVKQNPDREGGLFGNSNLFGAYLAPHAVLALGLPTAWPLLAAPMLYALWLTRCRAGILGAFVGSGALAAATGQLWIFSTACVLGSVVVFVRPDKVLGADGQYRKFEDQAAESFFSRGTFRARLRFWKTAVRGIAERPVTGYGHDVYKTRVPFLQREAVIPARSHRKAHNDLLQTALDTGLPGAVLLCGLVFSALTGAPPPAVGFFAAMAAAGIFLHTLYVIPLQMAAWCLLGAAGSQGFAVPAFAPPPAAWPFLIAGAAALVFRHAVRPFLADYLAWRYEAGRRKHPENLREALRLQPSENLYLELLANELGARLETRPEASDAIRTAIHWYDGERVLWGLFTSLGNLSAGMGSLYEARSAYLEALSFNPDFKPARDGLARVDAVLAQSKTIIHPNEEA